MTKKIAYKPKFCRTRGCSQRFGHDGGCDGPTGVVVPFHGRTPPAHGTSVRYAPARSPKARRGTDDRQRLSVVHRVVDRELRRRRGTERAQ